MKFIDWNKNTIAAKLQLLHEDAKPLWGQMNAAQMLQHLWQIAQIGNGKVAVTFSQPEDVLPKLRHILYKEVPFPREFAAPQEVEKLLETPVHTEFMELKNRLLEEIDAFDLVFANGEKTITNAVFGPLNRADWIWFHRKHISHHLAQFGLWQYE
ncbi:hypothetical protein GC194_06870 [bacterium]|nr:hypothetical protein [bacterium]